MDGVEKQAVVAAVPDTQSVDQTVDTRRCYQCDGRFGLTRHRLALKQFCSTGCLSKYQETVRKVSLLKEWRDLYTRKL
jgi:hypothetical protein